jgi:putative spermidine/putrescine transport system substrate-binding protein
MLEEKMKKRKVISLLAMFMGIAVFSTACGQTAQTQEGADTSKTAQNSDAVSTAASNVSSAGNASNAGSASNSIDLNSMTLDQITQKAKEDKEVDSVGMPDSWANWGQTWKDINSKYGITHNDSDMSSTEELQMFKTEGKNATKDIGDVGQAFGPQAVSQDLVLSYKTSHWDSVPDWAKDKDGKWMIAYTGATTFLVNTDLVKTPPTSWADMEKGDYKVAIGDINGGTAQAAVIASAYAFGGSLDNLDPAFTFWTKLAKAKRISTLDVKQQNFQTGEVPVGVIWSFTAIPYKNAITQYHLKATIPSDGSILSGYASVINKYAPHPYAAALAREYIFSDAGESNLASSGAIPTRTDVKIPKNIQDATFSTADYQKSVPMKDTNAYEAACKKVVSRWQDEILPLLGQ